MSTAKLEKPVGTLERAAPGPVAVAAVARRRAGGWLAGDNRFWVTNQLCVVFVEVAHATRVRRLGEGGVRQGQGVIYTYIQ